MWILSKVVAGKVAFEPQTHTAYDYILAISNMIKELYFLEEQMDYIDLWIKYRAQIWKTNILREHPGWMTRFEVVEGLENLDLEQGGLLFTFHYGDYRHGLVEIAQQILGQLPRSQFKLVVDAESYQLEKELIQWEKIKTSVHVSSLIAESSAGALQLSRHLRSGGWGFLYMDGNTGAGIDRTPLEIDFINSKIRLRSGIFRLMKMLKRPIYPVMTDYTVDNRPRLSVHPALKTDYNDISMVADQCIGYLRDAILYRPELWRFWYKHHQQVVGWKRDVPEFLEPNLLYRAKEKLGDFRVDLNTGNIFLI